MSYATEHSGAHADVKAAGAAVTLTRITNVENPTAGTLTPSTSTIPGVAMQVTSPGDRQIYRDLGLVELETARLMFVSDTYATSETPKAGDTLPWRGATWKVEDVELLEPDGAGGIFAILTVSKG